ncbi:DUF4328 domain-containing protein [Kitasatospora aureofaciens]|uniref:DUF4328 domain-containing protein n=1 Tax=Kitasatospora aureofaciens TaxID=1894 RepID=UPI001C465E0C|nr:DUF4328 domain-containing protein [Kitasatospora aureofaciens]MBV6699506.1 DUF4328 domain-containing protein [Kitasatospora aureofaciens]
MALTTQALLALFAVAQVMSNLNTGTGSRIFPTAILFEMPLFLGTIVAFLCWLRRCRLNAETFAPNTHKYSVGGAVGVWLVPVLNCWAPRRVMLDLWRANGSAGATWVINGWWVTWIAKMVGISAYVVAVPHGNLNNPVVVFINVAAAVLTIVMVEQVTAVQRAKIKE